MVDDIPPGCQYKQVDVFSETTARSLVAHTWTPSRLRAGVIFVSHGIAEHSLRYLAVISRFVERGYEVIALDAVGHGASALRHGRLGEFGEFGFSGMVEDALAARIALVGSCSEPVYFFGHSLGSFIGQHLMVDHADLFSGFIFSGSSALDLMLADLKAGRRGFDSASFNREFEGRTPYDWLSSDPRSVDSFISDPLCGFAVAPGEPRGFFSDAIRIGAWRQVTDAQSGLAVLFLTGLSDPISAGGVYVHVLAGRMSDGGIRDVSVLTFPRARHEIFHEVVRDIALAQVDEWLQARANTRYVGAGRL